VKLLGYGDCLFLVYEMFKNLEPDFRWTRSSVRIGDQRFGRGISQSETYSFMSGKPDFDLCINEWRRYKAAGTAKTQRRVANMVNDVPVGNWRV
jgi:hypothetical protein